MTLILGPMLILCWLTAGDAGTILTQYLTNVLPINVNWRSFFIVSRVTCQHERYDKTGGAF